MSSQLELFGWSHVAVFDLVVVFLHFELQILQLGY